MDALDRIAPAPLAGERLVLRRRLPDGSATDVIGWLTELGPGQVQLQDHAGRAVQLERAEVIAARRAPPARGGRDPLLTGAEELQRIALPGWVAHREPLGDWTLRAGAGFTGRANSCLVVGDPGMPVAEAASRIVAFAAAHGIPAWAQVVDGSDSERELRSLGWSDVYVPTDVLVIRLNSLLEGRRLDPRVRLTDTLHPEWLAAYHRSRPSTADPGTLRRILESEPPRAFAGVPDDDRLIAIGKGHVSRDWLGIAALWTTPEHRGRGWASLVMTGLGHWAARQGARNVYLQVATENRSAHRAYERMGFTRHHGYRYLQAPDQASSL
jgi:GNAT superfamily N-acetyltransferase